MKHGYTHISYDDYLDRAYGAYINQLPNEYISKDVDNKNGMIFAAKYLISEAKKYDKVVFDVVSQNIVEYIDRNNLFIVVVYASLEDLVRNVYNRRSTDPRGDFVFSQFAKRYEATDKNNGKAIASVTRIKFIEALKSKLKYLFESEDQLIAFATDIFKRMNINDDNKHYVKLRDAYQYDYILNTSRKQPSEICDELDAVLKL